MLIIKTLKRISGISNLNITFAKSSSQSFNTNCGHYLGRKFSRLFSNVARHHDKGVLPKVGSKETGMYTLPVKPKTNPLHPRNALFGRNDIDKHGSRSDMFLVEAFSTAEEYRFPDFYKAVSNKPEFEEIKICDELDGEVLAFRLNKSGLKKPSTIFIFREGTTVFWNFDQHDIKNTLQLLRAFEMKSYPDELVKEENEIMQFTYSDAKPKIIRNTIHITENENPPLSQYTFSNALALSVKLAIRESSLDYYVDNIKFISEDIRDGKKIKLTQDQVFRKTGELFNLRHHINLSSDLLDTPDFYWDRQELENLFLQTCNYLNTLKRTKVINEKLSHCLELMDLLQRHLSDKHHVRLEWMIIILIMVEVVFEFLHYFERLVDN